MDKIMPYLEQLANKLGVAVTHLWSVLVKQSVVDGIASLIVGSVFLILMFVLIKNFSNIYNFVENKYLKLKEDRIKNGTGYDVSHSLSSMSEDFWSGMRSFCIIGMLAFIIAFLFISMTDITFGIKHLINPEYYTLQSIINSIK